MLTRIWSRLTYANVIATLALFLALGGGAYAALKLPANSVGTKQLKSGAVNSAKVADRSLKAKDFAKNQLPAGARGPAGQDGAPGQQGVQGLPGTPGAPGSALGFALVHKCDPGACPGTGGYAVDSANSSHVDNDHFDHPAQGIFCFRNNLEFNGAAGQTLVSRNVVVTVGSSSAPMFAQGDSALKNLPSHVPDPACDDSNDPYGPNWAVVKVYDAAGALADPNDIFVVFN